MTGIWRASAGVLALLILVNLALSLVDPALWTAAAAAALAAGMFMCFRQGAAIGHGACGISGTVESARKAGAQVYAQLDKKTVAQAWRPSTGLKGALAASIIPWTAGALYIVLSLAAPDALLPLTLSRTAAWLLSLPYWPFIMHWHSDFIALTPAIAAMLLTTPFILPLCTFAGYLRGPALWRRTEEALVNGRRRAKARSRVGIKNYK